MATGEILNFLGSLCRMLPNLTTRAYNFFVFLEFTCEVGGWIWSI